MYISYDNKETLYYLLQIPVMVGWNAFLNKSRVHGQP